MPRVLDFWWDYYNHTYRLGVSSGKITSSMSVMTKDNSFSTETRSISPYLAFHPTPSFFYFSRSYFQTMFASVT